MGIAVLGPLQVDGGADALARRDRVVLAVLAMRTGELVSADQLAEALWAEGPPPTWNKALQGSVVRLRKLLGARRHRDRRPRLPAGAARRRRGRPTSSSGWSLARGSCWRSASPSGRRTCWGRRWRCGAETPFADLEDWGPASRPRPTGSRSCAWRPRSCGSTRCCAAAGTARSCAEAQAPGRAGAAAGAALGAAGAAQYQAGQQADALRTIHQLKALLAERAGPRPQPGVRRPRAGDPAAGPRAAAADRRRDPGDDLPLPGPHAVRRRGRGPFFGREADVEACLGSWLPNAPCWPWSAPRARASPRCCAPGSPPRCERHGQRVVVITPGAPPVEALTAVAQARRRAGPGGRPGRGGCSRSARTPRSGASSSSALVAEAADPDRGRAGAARRPAGRRGRARRRSAGWSSAGCTCSAR